MVHKIQAKQQASLTPTYGARCIREPIPKFQIPEGELPSQIAYQLVHDELSLDSNPNQNLASFVTTWMEPEAEQLLLEGAKINLADEDEYPHVIKIHERCIHMLGELFHAGEGAVGTAAIGSSEAIMLAGLAMKWRWRQKRQAEGLATDKPNLIMGENVQVVWEKFARYFDVTPKFIPVTHDRFILNAEAVAKAVDENTIGVCAILGSTFTGEFEPIGDICTALDQVQIQQGWDIPIHVDAASGGFVAPFLYPDLRWDFQLPRVISINTSGHKYGLVYPGIGWVLWRNQEALPEDLIFHVNYLGGDMPTFTLNFSRPASYVIAQYYHFLRLGKSGYRNIMENLQATANYIAEQLNTMDCFSVIGSREALPLVAWKVEESASFTAFDLSHKLREHGWVVPAYTMPKNAEDLAILRVVVREHLSRDLAENLIDDIQHAVADLSTRAVHTKDITFKRGKPC